MDIGKEFLLNSHGNFYVMSKKINMKDRQKEIVDKILLNLKNLSNTDKLKDEDIIKSIKLYKLIRELYKRNRDILKNEEFMWAYSAFYGLSAHYKKEDLPNYFKVMEKHFDKKDEMSIDGIVEELKTKKKHYVFASKLMNFVDDEKYPIIDGNIKKVFRFNYFEKVPSRYQTIISVYTQLKDSQEINDFIAREEFDFSGIGIMKQIDIIVWNIANYIPEKKKKIKGK